MTTALIEYRDEAEWLSLRQGDITSTETSALFSMSPYETLYELWHRKHSGVGTDFDADSERIQAGRHIEPAIASLASERFGVIVQPFKVYAKDHAARMGSSFDYVIVGVTNGPCADSRLREHFQRYGAGILECKNVDSLVFRRKWTDDETPAHIEIQLQHQLELTQYEWGCTMALVGGNRLEPYVRTRDRDVGAAIRQRIAKFWASVDAGQEPPPTMPDDAELVIAMHQSAGGDALDARDDDELSGLLDNIAEAKASVNSLESTISVLKAQILQKIGDADAVLWDGGKIATGEVRASDGKIITPDMVGQSIGGRAGFRNFRVYPAKEKTP